MLALEDFWSVLNLPTEAKYDATIERVARTVRPLSTAPEEDLLIILKRALFAWLIADGDMHLKNMALLKTAELGDQQFRSVRVAPLYDAVTTRVFPRLERDRMALKLNGRDDNLRRADFRALAGTAGSRLADADAAIDDLLERMARAIELIELPKLADHSHEGQEMAERMLEISRTRLGSFA